MENYYSKTFHAIFCTYRIVWKVYDYHLSIYENGMSSFCGQPGILLKKVN